MNAAAKHTPGPWHVARGLYGDEDGCTVWGPKGDEGGSPKVCNVDGVYSPEADARLIAAAPELLAALESASGYLLNAKIDLETGAPKRTAIKTIEGGLARVRAAIVKAEGGAP